MMVGVSAVFIGVMALAVSLYETSLMREEQKAAVLPLLELAHSFYVNDDVSSDDQWRLIFHAENVGIGPAQVEDFQVLVDGEPHPTWNSAIRKMLDRKERVRYNVSTINGRTVPPGRRIDMFTLVDKSLAPDIRNHFDRLDFEACFCSVFDECWTTRYTALGVTEPVAGCQRSEDSFRQ